MKKQIIPPRNYPVQISNTYTLIVKICGTIETPPEGNREKFRHGIIDTVFHFVRQGNFNIEYIGYRPDKGGMHYLNTEVTEFHDCIYASFSITNAAFSPVDINTRADEIVNAFTTVFEDKTNRHLDIDSTVESEGKRQRIIHMSSDWRFFRKHG